MRTRAHLSDLAIPAAILSLLALGLTASATSVRVGFMENKGQIHDQFRKPNAAVSFLLSAPGMNVQLRRDGFSYDTYVVMDSEMVTELDSEKALDSAMDMKGRGAMDVNVVATTFAFHRIDIRFVDGDPNAEIIRGGRSEDYTNYYTDVTGEAGATLVRSYSTITYSNVWPNIDVRFNSGEKGFKYDVVVRPGGDVNDARFAVEGALVSKGLDGRLVFSWGSGTMEEVIPESWLELDGKREQAAVSYRINGAAQFGFNSLPQGKSTLVIDPYPDLYWATYYGGNLADTFSGVAMDGGGSAYASGSTKSAASIATAGSFDAVFTGSENAMLVKMSPNGARAWATYFGGTGYTAANACAYSGGALWIGGRTDSPTGIATAGAFQATRDPFSADAFLAKFNTAGVRLYATYFGGRAADAITDIAIDAGGWLAVVGYTDSDNVIATIGSADASYGGNTDGFVSRFTPAGSRVWGCYIGGPSTDRVSGVTIVGTTALAVCGSTSSSTGLASVGAWDASLSGTNDAFLASYSLGGPLSWSTYFGGSGAETGYDCAWNGSAAIAICGHTNSSTAIATAGAQQTAFGGGVDAFLASFSTSAGSRIWATYAGGSCWDDLTAISYNGFGQWVVGGATCSDLGMATPGAYDTVHDWYDLFLTGYDVTGARLWATYMGCSVPEYTNDIVAGGNVAYVVGETIAPGTFATAGAHQSAYGGGLSDGLIARLNLTPPAAQMSPDEGRDHSAGGLDARIDNDRIVLRMMDADGNATTGQARAMLTIYDGSGRTVLMRPWPENTLDMQLPINGISAGPLMAVIAHEDGLYHTARIVIP
ncbi:MAG: hypothetical protein ABI599_17490 [Flavobacteriales bacterium]